MSLTRFAFERHNRDGTVQPYTFARMPALYRIIKGVNKKYLSNPTLMNCKKSWNEITAHGQHPDFIVEEYWFDCYCKKGITKPHGRVELRARRKTVHYALREY